MLRATNQDHECRWVTGKTEQSRAAQVFGAGKAGGVVMLSR